MEVTVRYHGIIGDMISRKGQQVEMPDGATIGDLLAVITGDDEHTQTILKQTRAFIDGKQADRAAPLTDGVEVIFMRPIAGGSDEGERVLYGIRVMTLPSPRSVLPPAGCRTR